MLLINGTVFTGKSLQRNLQVRLKNGMILETGENLAPESGEPVADLAGDYLLPGFVDVHIHAFHGNDTMRGEEEIRNMSRLLAKTGVSVFCPTTMSAADSETRSALRGIRAVMNRPEKDGAKVAGAHLEAPFLSEKHAGAQLKAFFRDPDFSWLEAVTEGHPEIVKLITIAPERPGSMEFIRQAAAAGIRVSIGHTDADAETVHRAADAGADHSTHTFNAQTPLLHRNPGVPGAALTDGRIRCEMICDGIHLHRDTVRLIAACKGPERAVAITDAMEAAGLPDGAYSLGGQKVFVKDGAARLADGTLAGSVLTMPQALENLIRRFGILPEDACAMCTSAPAASIGEASAGNIVPGSPVPLTRWNKDWEMLEVIGVAN